MKTCTPLGWMLREYKVSRSAIAESLGVSSDTVNNWCSGRSSPRVQHLCSVLSFVQQVAGLSSSQMQHCLYRCLVGYGLNPKNAADLLPPARNSQGEVVIFLNGRCGLPEALLAAGARDYLDQAGIGFVEVRLGLGYGLESVREFLLSVRARGVLVDCRWRVEWIRTLVSSLGRDRVPILEIYERNGLGFQGEVFVGVDNLGMGAHVADYMMKKGHKSFGFFGLDRSWPLTHQRLRGFSAAIEAAGFSLPPQNVYWVNTPLEKSPYISWSDHPETIAMAGGVARDLLSGRYECVFCASNSATRTVLSALCQMIEGGGFGSKEVVGVSESPELSRVGRVLVSYALVPYYRMGQESGKLLTLAQRSVTQVIVPYEFVPSEQVAFCDRRMRQIARQSEQGGA